MNQLCVHLFGKLQLTSGADEQVEIEAYKARELLAFLLLNRERALHREVLAGHLWHDAPMDRAKQYLRKALWQLQHALAEEDAPDSIILVSGDWIELNPDADLWVDTHVLENAYQAVRRLPAEDLTVDLADLLSHSVQIYHGELLTGWYQDWCLVERERHRHMHLALLDKLMRYYAANGDYETGISYGYLILGQDRAHERTHRWLMRLHLFAGDRSGALRQFQQCKKALAEELDVLPSERTQSLARQIRQGVLHSETINKTPNAIVRPQLSDLHQNLTTLQVLLGTVQRQVGGLIDPGPPSPHS